MASGVNTDNTSNSQGSNLQGLSNKLVSSDSDYSTPSPKYLKIAPNEEVKAKIEEVSRKTELHTPSYLKKLIEKVEKFQTCPFEMKEIAARLKKASKRSALTKTKYSEDIKRLEIGIKARDILVIWEKLAAHANKNRSRILEKGFNIPKVNLMSPELANLKTIEEMAKKGSEFIKWFNTSKPELQYLRSLKLSNLQLTQIPKQLCELYLEELDLHGNKLTDFPEELSQVKMLKILDLRGNKLTKIPGNFIFLTSLEELNLKDNQLNGFPNEVYYLAKLRRLNLAGNKLAEIPEKFSMLKNLECLDISNNKISSLTSEIMRIPKLITTGNPLTLTNRVKLMLAKCPNLCKDFKQYEQIAVIAVGCFGLYAAYWLS